jgi:ribosomal protein L7/L12
MITNPFPDKSDNVNAFDLVNAINLLLQTKQWNEVLRHFAASEPKEFIKTVESFRESGTTSDMFTPPNADFWLMETGANKINTIKILREMFGMGLADAKYLSESAPVKLFSDLSNSDNMVFSTMKLRDNGCKVMLKYPDAAIDPAWNKYEMNHTPTITPGWKRPTNYQVPMLEVLF